MASVQGMHQVERAIRIVARFHIHPHETAKFGRTADELIDVGQTLLVGEIETKLGKFQRDTALYAIGVDCIERPQVDVARLSGFVERGNTFAKMV